MGLALVLLTSRSGFPGSEKPQDSKRSMGPKCCVILKDGYNRCDAGVTSYPEAAKKPSQLLVKQEDSMWVCVKIERSHKWWPSLWPPLKPTPNMVPTHTHPRDPLKRSWNGISSPMRGQRCSRPGGPGCPGFKSVDGGMPSVESMSLGRWCWVPCVLPMHRLELWKDLEDGFPFEEALCAL